MAETRYGTCNLCEAMCGLEFRVEGRQVLSIAGDREDPLSRGHICPKAVALQDVYTDTDRLRTPLRRTEAGWQEISWDDALDLVATRLAEIRSRHGRNAVGVYLGNPNVHSLGAMTHGAAFTGLLRTRNRFSATSVDQLPHQFVTNQLYGHQLLTMIPDIDRTEYFLVFGANPMASNGSMMTVPDFARRRRALAERGGRLVLFDPRRTETAAVADEHHFIRPGTDAAVLLAMVRTILAEGLARPADYVTGVDAVRAAVEPFTPDAAAAVSGVDAATITRIAREFAEAGAAAAYGRVGVSMQRFGALCQWAIHLLNALTGNLDRPGGTLLTDPAVDIIGRGLVGKGHYAVWRSRVRGLPEFGGELPVSVLAEEIDTPGPEQIRALLTVAGNPVLSTPDGAGLDKSLATLDFMVAIDFYLNETTRHAEVILPPTSALERDHYDLIFHSFAVRNTARFSPALFSPEPGALHEWQIFRELGRRYLRTIGAPRKRRLLSALRLGVSPTRLVDLLLRTGRYRLSVRRLRRAPHGIDLGPLRPGLPGRLATKDNRVHAAPELLLADLGRARAELLDAAARDAAELRLIGRRHLRNNNSWMHNAPRLVKGRARHQLLIHPEDLAARGLADGALVRVTSRVGVVEVRAAATTDVMPGVVCLPHGFGHRRDGVRLSVASTVDGVSINDLTDPGQVDELSGNAVLNGVPVTVTSAADGDAREDSAAAPSAAAPADEPAAT